MTDLITGAFDNRVAAGRAVDRFQQLGYTQSDINVLMNENTANRHFRDGGDNRMGHGNKAGAGAGAGAVIGGLLGAIAAGLFATGSIIAITASGGAAVPLVAGPLAAALSGAGAGGIGGGVIGALVGAGIPKVRAEQYAADINSGHIIVGVYAKNGNESQIQEALSTSGAKHIHVDHTVVAL